MWDQLRRCQVKKIRVRIIPTYVGSTCFHPAPRRPPPNHSHVCGINPTTYGIETALPESFPRMWDQRRCVCVGEGRPANHSHVCWINLVKKCFSVPYVESFPRMWDQPAYKPLESINNRIIPTYVGSTRYNGSSETYITNHSHVCGINYSFPKIVKLIVESFPRMWDQRPAKFHALFNVRIIPTYVGSTELSFASLFSVSNHSHVCGINRHPAFVLNKRAESFPRMWDQPSSTQRKYMYSRIIPTYVGSTCSV